MPDSRKTDVTLDLDALERKDPPPPFKLKLGGTEYTLIDPQELEWRVLSNMRTDSSQFLGIAVEKALRREFNDRVSKLPAWKVRELVNTYLDHHGMPSGPESFASSIS